MNIEKIKKAKTLKDLELAMGSLENASTQEKLEITNLLEVKAKEAIEESKAIRKQAEELLSKIVSKKVSIVIEGNEYSLEEWVTISEYAKIFNLKSTSVVNNWIVRGLVPEENILKIQKLNNLQLIKAIPYLEK